MKKIDVKCDCKSNCTMVCSIEPKDGKYYWFISEDGRTFGGTATSQQEAINLAMKAIMQ